MQLFERHDDLCYVEANLFLFEIPFPVELRKEIAALLETEYQIKLRRRLKRIIHRC